MKKLLTILLTSLLSLAFALQLPFGQVEIKDGTGRLVALGKLVYDNFDLDLLQGFNGSAIMTITQRDGTKVSFEVVVTETNDILVVSGTELISLRNTLQTPGFVFEVWREERIPDSGLPGGGHADIAQIEAAVRALEAEALALGVTLERFQAKLPALVWAVVDLMQAGLSQDEALAVLRQGIATDPTLREVTTIVADKIDLKEAGLSAATIQAFLALRADDFGIAHRIFLEEYSTLAADLIDMIEAGIDEAVALAFLKEAMLRDPSLEEVSTIVSDFIDRQGPGDDDRHGHNGNANDAGNQDDDSSDDEDDNEGDDNR